MRTSGDYSCQLNVVVAISTHLDLHAHDQRDGGGRGVRGGADRDARRNQVGNALSRRLRQIHSATLWRYGGHGRSDRHLEILSCTAQAGAWRRMCGTSRLGCARRGAVPGRAGARSTNPFRLPQPPCGWPYPRENHERRPHRHPRFGQRNATRRHARPRNASGRHRTSRRLRGFPQSPFLEAPP